MILFMSIRMPCPAEGKVVSRLCEDEYGLHDDQQADNMAAISPSSIRETECSDR